MPFTVFSARSRPVACALALLLADPLAAQTPAAPPAASPPAASEEGAPPYADLADLALASSVIAAATIRSAARIKGAEAAGVAPTAQRFYVEADVTALIRSPGGLPQRLGYLYDAPLDPRGRAPKLKGARVLLFARPVAGSAGQLQLAAPDAQTPWSPAAAARARRIARELAGPDPAPAITGVGEAFHVGGALPGESETQLFLRAAGDRPVSLSVLRRPGEERRWSVALSEVVDEGAGPPARDTLLHHRLSCGLPPALPGEATARLAEEDAARAREDYAFVLERLGPCGRTRGGVTPAR